MKFLTDIISSITRKEFYKRIIEGKEELGFKYILKLQVLSALVVICIVSINLLGALPIIEGYMKNILPPGAEIIVKGGKLESNVNPIVIPMPQKVAGEAGNFKNFLVLDITTDLKNDDLNRKEALILVNSEGIISRTDGVHVQVDRFAEIPGLNITLDRDWFINKAAWAKSHAKYVPFILFLPVLIGFYIFALLQALFYGIFAYILIRLFKKRAKFKTAYSIGLYSRTFGLFLAILVFIIPIFDMAILAIPLNLLFLLYMINGALKSA